MQLCKKSSLLKQQTLSTSTTWKKDFWTLQGSDLVELFSQIPRGAINESVSGLGKGRTWVQEVIETVYLQSAFKFLTTLEHYFSLLGCFMLFPSFSPTPLRTFIAFQTEDAAEHHPTHNSVFSPRLPFIHKFTHIHAIYLHKPFEYMLKNWHKGNFC